MPNSYVEYSSGLTETTYSIPFNYIAIDDVAVKGFDGSNWSDLTVASRDASAKTVTLDAAPSAYQKIRVWRNTSTEQLVDFQNGSRLSERDLDTAYQQGLFVAQEVSENASTEVEGIGPQGPQGIQGPAGTDPFDESGNLVVTNGSVGVKTTPTVDLTIAGSAASSQIQLSGSDTSTYNRIYGDNSGIMILSADAGNTAAGSSMRFNVDASERMRIDQSGNFGLGRTDPVQRLDVYNATNNQWTCRLRHDGFSGVNYFLQFDHGGGVIGAVTGNGSSVTYATTSDYRLKENVVDITDGITRVKQLEPKKFNFIADAGTTVDGFIAHEAQVVVPESVTGTKDEVDDEGNPVMQGIDQAKLVPLLTAALQEAIAKIEDLETRVEALENA